MKGMFCCDWPIYKDIDGNYYDITLTNEVLERYLSVVDELTIVIRVETLRDTSMIKNLSKINLDKIKIVEIPNLLSLSGLLYEKKKVYKMLYDIINETDLIFIRIPSCVGNEAINIARKMKKPYLVEVGGCAWDSYWNHSLKGKLIAPYIFLKTRKAVKYASQSVYVTSEFLQKRYPCKGSTYVCSNVVLHQTDDEILINRNKRIKENLMERPIIIGTVAAVNVKYKGQQYVIKAISKLNKQGYNFEYHLVGNGDNSYLKNLAQQQGIADKIKFLGIMKRDDILKYLDNIDIYAQPSKQEGLPRALIEAMSRGCASIGSTTAGIPELLEDSMVFKNGNINQICDRLKKLVKEGMEQQSKLNFYKAKEYESSIIEERRSACFKEYLNLIKKKK